MSVFRPDCLSGHVALITGGGTGICRAIAHAYLAHGASVCITSRKQEVLDRSADELREATGGQVLAIASDVRKPEAVADVVTQVLAKFDRLDTVVNGAAGNFLAPAVALSPNGFKTVVDIDLCGTFNTSKACFEALKASGNGLVLNITATLHYHGTPMQAHASAAKAGVDALTKNLAVEWGPTGIRVNGIAPGPIEDTEGMKRLAPGKIGEKVKAQIPLRRFGASKEIADAAVFLRSQASQYITGTTLVVDGGQCVVGHTFLQ